MKKKILGVLLLGVISINALGCNTFARKLGGKTEIDLPDNKKLLECTWKDDDSLWYLVRDMREDENEESYEFKEDSNFGVIEGTVIIKEHKK